jgi:hypothetical protein
MGESPDPSFIVSSFWRMVPVGLIIEGTITIIVSFITSFVLDAVSLLVPVFNPVACISIVDNVTQVPLGE